MPRKPNYRFERIERERLKAEKKAARAAARADRKNTQEDTGEAVEGLEAVEGPGDDNSATGTGEISTEQD